MTDNDLPDNQVPIDSLNLGQFVLYERILREIQHVDTLGARSDSRWGATAAVCAIIRGRCTDITYSGGHLPICWYVAAVTCCHNSLMKCHKQA